MSALINRAASLGRVGEFRQALRDFEEADTLLGVMNYPSLKVETLLFWAFEHSSALGNWTTAKAQYEEARKIIDFQPDSYIEEQARLYIGLGQVELNNGNYAAAERLLKRSRKLIIEKELIWWRPIAEYYLGCVYKFLDKPAKAIETFTFCFTTSYTGCPYFKPLILLELAQLEDDLAQRNRLLVQCIRQAKKRSRFVEKLYCLEQAGQRLVESKGADLREMGENVLAEVHQIKMSKE